MKNVVVGIISRKRKDTNEFLLISSKRDFGKHTGFYYPPGGHLEKGENEKTSLIREVQEELGIKITPIEKIAETPGDVKDQATHWWKCINGNNPITIDEKEISEIGWFTRNEILKHQKVWPATKKFFEQYISD